MFLNYPCYFSYLLLWHPVVVGKYDFRLNPKLGLTFAAAHVNMNPCLLA